MKQTLHTKSIATTLACLIALGACSDRGAKSGTTATGSDAPAASAPSAALEKIFATPPAGEPVPVVQARQSAQPGQTVTVKGLVMGSVKPFVEGRAAFTLGDPQKLTPCNKRPDDTCGTPWDVCCEPAEAIKGATLTVQVVGPDGKVLREPVQNVHGLKPLSEVTVTGTVTPASGADALVLDATSIHVGQ